MADQTSELKAQRISQIFRKALPARVKLGEVVRTLDFTPESQCLTVSVSEVLLTYHLHQRVGKWSALAYGDEAAERFQGLLGSNIKASKSMKMPFKEKTFDFVIVLDAFERVQDVESLIIECHRVLKPTGRLVAIVPNTKPWSIVRPLVSLMGVNDERRGWVRPGYTEQRLFRQLKDGFDVFKMQSFSRFFVEFIDGIRIRLVGSLGVREEDGHETVLRYYTILYPLYWIGHQLDTLIFFTRGHYLIATAKRRAWLPRKTPVLSDGRSITEAVLSRIGD